MTNYCFDCTPDFEKKACEACPYKESIMHSVTEGKDYIYGTTQQPWGKVISLDIRTGLCVVSLAPWHVEREFGLYEVSAWIKSNVLMPA